MSTPGSPGAATARAIYPIVGIVTPVRNRRTWSIGFARMIAQQDYPFLRLYMVDAASSDGTPAALDDLGLPFLKLIAAPDSAYWTGSTNMGVEQALADGCEYILTINDDAIIASDYLSTFMKSILPHRATIVGSVISYVSRPGCFWGVGAHNNWKDGAFLQLSRSNQWEDDASFPAGKLIPTDYLCGNGTLIHRSVFETIGLYDARRVPHYHADSEFTMRAERAGIARWVSPDVRLYNRFSDLEDGGFSPRNRRFFSLRSANYVGAVVHVLDRYCPDDLKATALVNYYARYINQTDWRTWSRMLRLVVLLDTPAEARRVAIRDFFPSNGYLVAAAHDMPALLGLPDRNMIVMAYAYLLRRPASEAEILDHLAALNTGSSREQIMEVFLSSEECRSQQADAVPYLRALVACHANPLAAIELGRLEADERGLIDRYQGGTMPSGVGLAPIIGPEAAGATVDAVIEPGMVPVYVNIDILCMAMLDPYERTAMHRYVDRLLWTLAERPGLRLILFHSEGLAESCAMLIRSGRLSEGMAFADPHERPMHGVVFYPCHPRSGIDRRFRRLAMVVTVADISLLTNPEWFPADAVASFRHQTKLIAAADHIICISAATEARLREVSIGLCASTSVASPGVDRPQRLDDKLAEIAAGMVPNGRYFLCFGTIDPQENLTSVIAAMRMLDDEGSADLSMLAVSQESWSAIRDRLRELSGNAASRILLLGHVPDELLPRLYAGAVCTVFPSLAEGFACRIVESLAAGTPVIIGRGSSMGEIARRGAVMVDPLSAEEIAAAIRRLATDDALREALSVEAGEAATRFTWTRCADAHVAVFESLATRRARARLSTFV